VDLTPEDLERAEFDTTEEGFDPEQVRVLLTHAAERIRELEEKSAVIDLTEDAAELAARRITEADQLAAGRIAYAERQAEEMVAAAEADARSRAGAVLSEAQRRLDRMLAAERDVHDRLKAAVTDLTESVTRVGVDQSRELALTVEEPTVDPVSIDDANWADSSSESG
jgi:F0F1-type ATP synthase membrane subunit b/b'